MSKVRKSRGGPTKKPAPSVLRDDIRSRAVQGQEVKFLGWQKTSGDLFPLYNIVKVGHQSERATVTEKNLQGLHLRIPRTPSPFPDVGKSPWHDLGSELISPATAREAIEAAGLDFTVIKRPLKEVLKLNHPTTDVSARWATVRTDTGDVLGIVGGTYEPIQNKDAFTFFDNLVGTDEAIYETAGVIDRGRRIWILAKLPGYIKVRGTDIVSKYLLLSNSHDGSSHVQVKLTPIRVVCNNTLNAALRGNGEVQIHHSLNAAEDLKQALSLLGLSNSLYKELDAIFNRMALKKITEKQLMTYVMTLIPDIEGDQDITEIQRTQKAVLELHESGHGADLCRGTIWGAFNAVTEYADHAMEDNPNTRLESIWSGRGEQLTMKAFQLAEGML